MWRVKHLSVLKDICQVFSHISKLLRSSCSLTWSDGLFITRYSKESSANNRAWDDTTSGRSFINIIFKNYFWNKFRLNIHVLLYSNFEFFKIQNCYIENILIAFIVMLYSITVYMYFYISPWKPVLRTKLKASRWQKCFLHDHFQMLWLFM